MLKEFKEATVSGGDSLCRMVLLLKLRRLKEAPMSIVESRPLWRREEALCRPEEAGSCAERRSSVPEGLMC